MYKRYVKYTLNYNKINLLQLQFLNVTKFIAQLISLSINSRKTASYRLLSFALPYFMNVHDRVMFPNKIQHPR